MSATTLAIVNAPTLRDGLVELLRIADALQLAADDCGVWVQRTGDGRLWDAEADYDVPPGVIETSTRLPVDPWDHTTWSDCDTAEDRRKLVEVLAAVTDCDLELTADAIRVRS